MKPFVTKLLIVCGAVLGLTVFASTAAAAPAKSGHAKGSFLYLQESTGGSIQRLGAGTYRLRLTGVSPRVATFTDRPRRRAGRQGLAGFVGSWKANGFAADPPSAALVLDHAPASRDVALLTLTHPRYNRAQRTLTYRATPLRERDTTLASFARRADPVKPGDFDSASLYVDEGTALSTVVFTVIGEATASTVQFLLDDGGAWSLSSVDALSISGIFPITSLYETGKMLSLGLPPGSALNFTVSLPIEAEGTGAPVVEVTNMAGTITVTWMTNTGPATQVLVPGDPVTLNNLAS